jgi:DNA primase
LSVAERSLDEFKARLPLAEIIGRYVKLTRRGREQLGLCPFHKEKTPSFNVVEDKGFYHCFGCGAHGTAIDFIMAVESLSFGDALERLADLTGLPVPRRSASPEPRPSERIYAANAAAAAWFQAQLLAAGGREVLAYLERRGIDRATARKFELGHAPQDGEALWRALAAEGFADAELLGAGLIKVDEGGRPFAHFRHRLMFPIADERGRVVGFGGRALGDARAKYLNTPETEVFHKGDLLYNLHRGARPARERREVVLAEGYMDVIALTQAGIAHAVAPLGTSVTERQLASLWRLAETPIVCLDGDRAGLAAAMRAAERALPVMRGGQSLRFAMLPDGDDPDSYLRRHGAAALSSVLSKAHTLSQMVWRLETQDKRFETPEARAGLSRRLRALARLAADPDLRASLLDEFRSLQERFVPPRHRRTRREGPSSSAWEGVGPARLEAGLADPQLLAELRVVVPVVHVPAMLVELEDEFDRIQLSSPLAERLRNEILFWYNSESLADRGQLRSYLERFPELISVISLVEGNVGARDFTRHEYERMFRNYLRKAHIAVEHGLMEEKAAMQDYDGVLNGFRNLSDLQQIGAEDDDPTAFDVRTDMDELNRTGRDLLDRLGTSRPGRRDDGGA